MTQSDKYSDMLDEVLEDLLYVVDREPAAEIEEAAEAQAKAKAQLLALLQRVEVEARMADKHTQRDSKLKDTKSVTGVSYSHPLTDADKVKVDKLVDSIKQRKAKK